MEEEKNTEAEPQITIPTFLRKSEMAHQNSGMPTTGVHKSSLHVFRRSRRPRRECSRDLLKLQQIKEVVTTVKKDKENSNGGGGGGAVVVQKEKEGEEEEEEEEEEDEREEIERKIHALQRIVPGGESFGVDKLFDETAGYIVTLQYQVKALKALAGFFEKLEKENTKFGG